MYMKFGIVLVAIVLAAAAGWFFTQPPAEPTEEVVDAQAMGAAQIGEDDDIDPMPPEETGDVEASTDPVPPSEEGVGNENGDDMMDEAMSDSTELATEPEMTEDDAVVEAEAEVEADASSDTDDAPAEVTFTLDSFNFGYSMDEIRVNEGDTVTINLTSSDGFHDWVVDEFGAATEKIQAGGNTSVTFVASEAGTYEYYCSVGNHRAEGMVGTLIVE